MVDERVRRIMQAVKSSGSKIEVRLAKAIWAKGYRYRKNNKSVFGTPDLTFKKVKLAIFVDSEFWHGKDWEKKRHDLKTNIEFWQKKIEKNIARDEIVNKRLINDGWTVLRFWGKDIEKQLDNCVKIVDTTFQNLQARSHAKK